MVIAGGGLAGMVTAFELLDAGKKVLLIDKDVRANFGGLARESFGGGGLHGKGALEGAFLGACVLTGKRAAMSIAAT